MVWFHHGESMPRLALNLLVLNGEAVVRRCLASVVGAIDELVVVDSGSSDRTRKVVVELAESMALDRFRYERMSPLSDDFFTDEPASYGSYVLSDFSGRRVLKDWAKARNLALAETSADYVLKLDADDELISPPENLRKACGYLDTCPEKHFVFAPYEIYDEGKPVFLSMQSRLWRRGAHTRWVQPMHEYLRGMLDDRCLHVAQGIRIRDWKDSPGEGVRIQHRNLKVMLWHHVNQPRTWPGHDDAVWLFTLATEAVENFPAWSRELFARLLARSDHPNRTMAGDCFFHIGRALEAEGDLDGAMKAYLDADLAGVSDRHLLALMRAIALHRRLGTQESVACRGLTEKLLQVAGCMPDDPLPFNVDLQPIIALREGFKKE